MGRGKRAGKGTSSANAVSVVRFDKTGIIELDELLHDFVQEEVAGDDHSEGRLVSDWRYCTMQDGGCRAVSEAFVEFASVRGFKAALSDTVKGPEFVNNPSSLGYRDRPIKWGSFLHTVALIYLDDGIYAVDWSAHQYGYTTFPVVSKYSQGNFSRLDKTS